MTKVKRNTATPGVDSTFIVLKNKIKFYVKVLFLFSDVSSFCET